MMSVVIGIFAYVCLGILITFKFSEHYDDLLDLNAARMYILFVTLWPLFLTFWAGVQSVQLFITFIEILTILVKGKEDEC